MEAGQVSIGGEDLVLMRVTHVAREEVLEFCYRLLSKCR